MAARFTSDDKIFFTEEAESIGLRWNSRKNKERQKIEERKKEREIKERDAYFKKQNSKRGADEPESPDDLGDVDTWISLDGTSKFISKTNKSKAAADELQAEDAALRRMNEFLWSRWMVWKHIGLNRAYLFRYSFRICDVISRLMILALIWCSLSAYATIGYVRIILTI